MNEAMVKMRTTVWLVLQLQRSRFLLLVLWTCFILICPTVCQMNNITTSSNITLNTNNTMVSPRGIFELGFTNGTQLMNSSIVYALAIWYAQIKPQTVVWIANRSMALSSHATLTITPLGNLQVSDHVGGHIQTVWTSNTAHLNVTMACICDDGSLVVVNGSKCTTNSSTLLWQSFASYSDTLLPFQKYRISYNASSIFSWKNKDDWRKGNYSLQWLFANVANQTLSAIWQTPFSSNVGFQEYWRQDHVKFLVLSPKGVFQSVDINNVTTILAPSLEAQNFQFLRVTLDRDGNLRMYSWLVGSSTMWKVVWTLMPDCNIAGYCGPNVLCNNGIYTCITESFEFIDPNNFRLGCKRIKSKSSDVMAPLGAVDYAFSNLDVYNKSDKIPLHKCLQLCLHSEICQMVVIPNTNSTMTTNSAPGLVDSCWLKRSALLNGRNLPLCLAYIRVNAHTSPSRIKQIVPSILGVVVVILCIVGCGWFFCSQTIAKRRL